MTLSTEGRRLRMAIRSDRMRQVFDQAVAAGWDAQMRGSGHIRMHAPNDRRTFLTISCTASGARSALNVEAVLKRWLRQQETPVSNENIERAIDKVETDQTLDALGLKHGAIPQIPEREPEQEPVETPDYKATEVKPASDEVTCPECGRTFKRYGYGNHLAGHRRDKANGAPKPVTPVTEAGTGTIASARLFSINEVVTIAEFGGAGGLIEVSKLRDGLLMVARLREDK